MDKCRFAVDLLWVRPNQVGGIESVARNLLDGLVALDDEYECWLIVSKDNARTFVHYSKDTRINVEICNIASSNVKKRIIWQNLYLGRLIRSLGINKCFEPYYCKPILGTRRIKFITVIHDLQALHYPEYFSRLKVLWMRFSWWNTIRTSRTVVTISDYVRNDIFEHFKVDKTKIVRIYNPVIVDTADMMDFTHLNMKYNITPRGYFFTVSSLLPHKNILTLVKLVHSIKERGINLPDKLIVSGVGGKSRDELQRIINEMNLTENIQLTTYIENSERNSLYKNCRAFLFPSFFEGFGMPPVEALMLGAPVVTSRLTSLEEVTRGFAQYVSDPYDVEEWIEAIESCSGEQRDFVAYRIDVVAKRYLSTIQQA